MNTQAGKHLLIHLGSSVPLADPEAVLRKLSGSIGSYLKLS